MSSKPKSYLPTVGVILALSVTALVAAFLISVSSKQVRHIEGALYEKSYSFSTMLRQQVASAVAFGDVETAREAFLIAAMDPDVVALRVYYENGEILYQLGELGTAGTEFSLEESFDITDDRIRVIGPVLSLEGPRGTLVVELSRKAVISDVRTVIRSAVLVGVVTLFFTLAVIWLVMRLRRSVTNLHKAQERLVVAQNEERDRLEAKERELHQFLDQMPVAVQVIDKRGSLVFSNAECRRLLEVAMDEDAVCHWHWQQTGEPCAESETPTSRALAGETLSSEDLRIVSGSAGAPVSCTAAPIHGDDGEIQFAMVAFQDITQKLRDAALLLQAQKLESVGQLAAGIAHEINTPMQYIGDNAHFVRKAVDSLFALLDTHVELLESHAGQKARDAAAAESKKRKLRYLRKRLPKAMASTIDGVESVSKLVRSMKEFSHPGSEDKTPVNLNQAIETTVDVSRNEWKYVAEIDFDLDPDLPTFYGLRGEINQVILNMIVNAAHAIGDSKEGDSVGDGVIKLSTRVVDGAVELSIGDNGTGMPADVVDRIFDPFYTTKEVGRGTGQGLAIARGIVNEKHSGEILVESTVGVGTTFRMRFPLAEQAETEQAA